MIPDAERIVIDFLMADPAVRARLDDRIYNRTPAEKKFPMARAVRYGGAPAMDRPLYVDAPSLQVDVWADRQVEARDIAEVIRAALAERLPGARALGVVTDVRFGPFRNDPDEALVPPKPRYRFDVDLTVHPLRQGVP